MEIPKPHDLEIEKAVLGAMLLEYPALELVISFLRTEHFYDIKHQIIYEALLELYNNGQEERDILVMTQKLKTDGTLKKAGGPAYIAEVTQNISSAANIEEHARILQQMYFMRELVNNSVQTISNVKANIDFFELLESREKFDFSIQSQLHTTEVHSISEVSKDIGRKLAIPANNTDGITGLPTGFLKSIDIPMAGLQNELIYLAGRPGQGKSQAMLNMARNMAIDFKIPVAIFSIEMSKESLVTRIQSAHTRIQRDKFKRRNFTEQDWVLYNSRIQDVITAPIYIDDTPSINILELRSKGRKLVKKKGVKAVFIDYIQLITTTVGIKDKVGNREQEISYISKHLLAMRKELGIPVIALSQLSRAVESRQDKRPMLSDLRESGSLEQDADIVLFLYRPWYYKQEATDPHTNESLGRHYTELIYGKFREGAIDSYGLSFIGEFSYMEDYRHEIPDWAKYNPNPITIPDSYERNEIFRTLPPERSKEDMPF